MQGTLVNKDHLVVNYIKKKKIGTMEKDCMQKMIMLIEWVGRKIIYN